MANKKRHLNPVPSDDPTPAATVPEDPGTPKRAKEPHDPDAAWGNKTGKHGDVERFYGYHEHTLVQVPHSDDDKDAEPRLIKRFELTPANADVVDVSLSLIDRVQPTPTVLIADRHYHYKKPERWRDPLSDLGIDTVLDLRVDEHGFTDLDRTRWAAGWPHCPATPEDLATIVRPPNVPGSEPTETFRARIAARQAYAFRRVTSPDARGVARWECPAAAGTVGCPLRPGTVEAAVKLGLPIIENPPDPNSPDFPKCCTQRTITIDPGPLRKLMQKHYWGSDAWTHDWNKRTYVEGTYGNRKNPSTEDVRRGHHRITGLTLVHVANAMSAAAHNIRMLRNWHERTGQGDPDHPLLQPAEEEYTLRVTKEEYEQYCQKQLRDDA